MKKRQLVIGFILPLVLALSACSSGGGSTNTTPAPSESSTADNTTAVYDKDGNEIDMTRTTLVTTTNTDPGNFDPMALATYQAETFYINVMEKMLSLNEKNEVEPALATEYEFEDDTTLVLTMREGVKFHNGETMTMDDVKYSFDTYMATPVGMSALAAVDSVEVRDDTHIVLHMKQPDATVVNVLAGKGPYIVPKAAYEEMGSTEFGLHPIGTNYFKWDNYVAGDYAHFVAFDDYWGDDHGTITDFTIRIISETSQALIELENGNVNFVPGAGVSGRNIAADNPNIKEFWYNIGSVQYLGFNCLGILGDENIRKAIACALDNQTMIDGACDGIGTPAYSIVPAALWGYNPNCETNYAYEYNMDKAKEYLAAAGYPDGGFKLTILSDTANNRQLQAQICANQLNKLGIETEIIVYESATVVTMLTSGEGYDICVRGIVGFTGEAITDVYIQTAADAAYIGGTCFHHMTEGEKIEKYTDLMNKAKATIDDDGRKQYLYEAQEVFMDLLPLYPVYNADNVAASDKDLVMTSNAYLRYKQAYYIKGE